MGIINTTLRLRNILTGGKPLDLLAKVDTGATLLVIPGSIAKDLQLPVIRTQTVKYANEQLVDREVVYGVEVEICNRKGVFEAIVEPDKTYALLGAVVMETLDLIVEPRELRVYPNPRSSLPMVKVE